ncbi:hypothetical protein [Dactylosporangium sp. CA-092794]|uniref:hypothetical protein n=1 Tax=Dactylosporangium sp. CA-092794 TaxID=3239929 RepID=UPI003D92D354
MTDQLLRWAREVCASTSRHADDLATAMGLDLNTAEVLGSQWIFDPPPPGTSYCEYVVDDDDTLLFAEFIPDAPTRVEDLVPLFGDGRAIVGGPHDAAPTVMFELLAPPGASHACRVTARLRPSDPQTSEVESVLLHPRLLPAA